MREEGPSEAGSAARPDLPDRLKFRFTWIRRGASPARCCCRSSSTASARTDPHADLINGVTLDQARRVTKRLLDPDRLGFCSWSATRPT